MITLISVLFRVIWDTLILGLSLGIIVFLIWEILKRIFYVKRKN